MTENKETKITTPISSTDAKLTVFVWKNGPDGTDKGDPLCFDLLSERKREKKLALIFFFKMAYKDLIELKNKYS